MRLTHPYARLVRIQFSVTVAFALFGLSLGNAQAGQIDPDLQAAMDAGAPNDFHRVIVHMSQQVDLLAESETWGPDTNRLLNAILALKDVAHTTQNQAQAGEGCGGGSSLREQIELAVVNEEAMGCSFLWLPNGVTCDGMTPSAIEAIAEFVNVGAIELLEDEIIDGAGPFLRSATAGEEPEPTSWSLDVIQARNAQAQGFTGAGARIGIMSTGVDVTHPELVSSIHTRSDGSPFWLDPTPENASSAHDPLGHGTYYAGIAVGDEVGVAPDAELLSCKVVFRQLNGDLHFTPDAAMRCVQFLMDPICHNSTDSGECSCVESETAEGCQTESAQHAAHVVLFPHIAPEGHCTRHQGLNRNMRKLREANILMVAPSGRPSSTPRPGDGLGWPANFRESLSVGSSSYLSPTTMDAETYRDTADCSLPSDPPPARLAPQIFAPGEDVRSAKSGGGYHAMNDHPEATAAAHVAGAAALLYGMNPYLPVKLADRALVESAPFVENIGDPVLFEPGLLDVHAALRFDDAVIEDMLPPGCDPNLEPDCRTLPSELVTGHMEEASIILRNTGIQTWDLSTHFLRPLGGSGWAIADSSVEDPTPNRCGRIALQTIERIDLPYSVPPGEGVEVPFPVRAPNVPDRDPGHSFQWELVSIAAGEALPATVASTWDVRVPVRGIDCAHFESIFESGTSQSPTAGLTPNEGRVAEITFANNGTTTWNTGYLLNGLEESYETWVIPWLPPLPVDREVPPCEFNHSNDDECRYTFTFGIQAPATPWIYPFCWQMRNGTEEAWLDTAYGLRPSLNFGQLTHSDEASEINGCSYVMVNPDLRSSLTVIAPSPQLVSGQDSAVFVDATNTGSQSWSPGTCLVGFGSPWSNVKECLGAGETVASGQTRRFFLGFTAPQQAGNYTMNLRLQTPPSVFAAPAFFGGQTSTNVSVLGELRWSDHYRSGNLLSGGALSGGWFMQGIWSAWLPNGSEYWVCAPGGCAWLDANPNGHWNTVGGGNVGGNWMSPPTTGLSWRSDRNQWIQFRFWIDDDETTCSGGNQGDGVAFWIVEANNNDHKVVDIDLPPGGSHFVDSMWYAEAGDIYEFHLRKKNNTTCDTTIVSPTILIYP